LTGWSQIVYRQQKLYRQPVKIQKQVERDQELIKQFLGFDD
jgi:hypothetical protein